MNANMKTRSQGRFEALHHLLNEVVPTLPRASHVQVLITCWIHAHTAHGNVQEFDLTKQQIAENTKLSPRQIQRCLNDLEAGGVIKTRKRGKGNRGSIRIITGFPYQLSET